MNKSATHEAVRYCVFQLEESKTKKEHIQTYCEMERPIRLTQMKKIFGRTSHWEKRRGSREQARAYCMKEESRIEGPFEIGDFQKGGQGKRNDIVDICAAIKRGEDFKKLEEDNLPLFFRYYKAFDRYRMRNGPQRNWQTELHIYYGPPGTGKSRKAFEENPGAYWKPNDQWWDGYNGQEVVILDDFTSEMMSYRELLRVCDRYPLPVRVKGGFEQLVAKKVIITSNLPYTEWYLEYGGVKALERRITSSINFGTKVTA